MADVQNPATVEMIKNIIDGTTPVAKANSAVTDSEGNNIASTYATKDELEANSAGNKTLHIATISGSRKVLVDYMDKEYFTTYFDIVVQYYSSKKTAYTRYSELVSSGDALGTWFCAGDYYTYTRTSGGTTGVYGVATNCAFDSDGVSVSGVNMVSARLDMSTFISSFAPGGASADTDELTAFSDRVVN